MRAGFILESSKPAMMVTRRSIHRRDRRLTPGTWKPKWSAGRIVECRHERGGERAETGGIQNTILNRDDAIQAGTFDRRHSSSSGVDFNLPGGHQFNLCADIGITASQKLHDDEFNGRVRDVLMALRLHPRDHSGLLSLDQVCGAPFVSSRGVAPDVLVVRGNAQRSVYFLFPDTVAPPRDVDDQAVRVGGYVSPLPSFLKVSC